MTGGGNPPMPPSALATTFIAPFPGGGNPPMPPSSLVLAPAPPTVPLLGVVSGLALYSDGTIGYPNGDFQFTSGAYLWADGFVRFSPAPLDFEWTNYAGTVIATNRGDVAANGLPHVEFLSVLGLNSL